MLHIIFYECALPTYTRYLLCVVYRLLPLENRCCRWFLSDRHFEFFRAKTLNLEKKTPFQHICVVFKIIYRAIRDCELQETLYSHFCVFQLDFFVQGQILANARYCCVSATRNLPLDFFSLFVAVRLIEHVGGSKEGTYSS